MINGFVLKKGTMASVFNSDGRQLPVTTCHTPILTVTQIKTDDKPDGYTAIQFAIAGTKKAKKPIADKLKKLKLKLNPQFFIEFKPENIDQLPKIGDNLTIDSVFSVGDKVAITGYSKGRGFAGVIKRHGFHRQPVTMGASDRTRSTGAIGAQTPGRVIKGKRMPGHFGNKNITVKNIEIIDINKELSTITFKGSIPGHINSYLTIKKHYAA